MTTHADEAHDPELVVLEAFGTVERLARALHVPSGELQPTLEAIVRSAVHTVPVAEEAGLILVRRGELLPVVTTGERPTVLDELQRSVGEGPCFDAAADQKTVVVTELAKDDRWAKVQAAAARMDVVSMVCLPLWVEERTTGALSLYSSRAGAFDQVDLAWAELFATHAALALADAERSEQLRTAMASRDVLGQAKGILMERLRLDADAAFTLLTTASQNTNTKVTTVAEHLVQTGELIEPGKRARG